MTHSAKLKVYGHDVQNRIILNCIVQQFEATFNAWEPSPYRFVVDTYPMTDKQSE